MTDYLVDTNIFVRLITNDVPELAQAAEAMITPLADKSIELPLYVLAEVVYVLAYNPHYRYDRPRIVRSLRVIVGLPQFELERAVVERALEVFARRKLDFVDCLLAGSSAETGREVLTFDKKLRRQTS